MFTGYVADQGPVNALLVAARELVSCASKKRYVLRCSHMRSLPSVGGAEES